MDSLNNRTADSEQPKDTVIELNGEKLTLEELKNGYMRQSDYTKKTQELKKAKESDGDNTDDDIAKAVATLKDKGFVTKEQIENDRRFEKLVNAIPELSGKRKLIEDLSKSQNKAPEDIVAEYGLVDETRLAEYKNGLVMGNSLPKEKQTELSIKNMTPEQYENWKNKNKKTNGFWS
jgi:hypothetical protein